MKPVNKIPTEKQVAKMARAAGWDAMNSKGGINYVHSLGVAERFLNPPADSTPAFIAMITDKDRELMRDLKVKMLEYINKGVYFRPFTK